MENFLNGKFNPNILIDAPEDSIQAKIFNSLFLHTRQHIKVNLDSSDLYKQMQAQVLKELLAKRVYNPDSPEDWSVFKKILLKSVQIYFDSDIQQRSFDKNVIGGIRDSGIILSGTNKGLSIALDFKQINDYLKHNKNVILPMLARIDKARTIIKSSTNNEYDLLERSQDRGFIQILQSYC